MAADPSQNVHGDVLPHVHLLSASRYPTMPRVELNDVTKWLLQAPKIARDGAPFYWTYLDCPADGTIFLTWQPTSQRGTEFASDGYVWSGPEMLYPQTTVNGLILEIYVQRSGFRLGDQFATHSRRRFRLCPPRGPAPVQNVPQVDPNLWIVHYGPAEKNDRLPVASIGIPPPMQAMLNSRHRLLSMGQIVRKEFMLSDRVNWPQIPSPFRGQTMYPPPMPQRPVPQAMAYPPHPGAATGQTPRRRGAQQAPPPGQPMMAPGYPAAETPLDDEEDISRGDMFDHLTPRELAMARYQQNHEWMEEILSSPYRIGQIEPVDLGLGRRGELASLTEGIFEAQGAEAVHTGPKKPYTGQLDPGLADQFRARVKERVTSVRAEIEEMKAKHAAALAEFKSNAAIKQAERELRAAVEGTGNEIWRLEGRIEDDDDAGSTNDTAASKASLDEIVARVEKLVGRRAVAVGDVQRIQDGGYQELAPEPVQPASQSMLAGDSDIDMGGTAAGLLDIHAGFSSTSTPANSFPTPQPHLMPSNAATPASNIPTAPSPAPIAQVPVPGQVAPTSVPPQAIPPQQHQQPQSQSQQQHDIQMTDAAPAAATTASGPPAAVPAPASTTASAAPPPPAGGGSKPVSAANTPGLTSSLAGDDLGDVGLDENTAGDALASYEAQHNVGSSVGGSMAGDELNMDDMVVDVGVGGEEEDTAFGDAFHGVEQAARDGGDEEGGGEGK